MKKIGTHDSMTGEPSMWFSIPFIPFARTQSKDIFTQWLYGCRLFDLRTRFVCGKWRGAHGLWVSKTGIEDVIGLLNTMSSPDDPIHVSLTYEGKLKNAGNFSEKATEWKQKYTDVRWGPIAAKYKDEGTLAVEYGEICKADPGFETGVQAFLPLDGKHWQTLIPIPWLWKQFYHKHVEYSESVFQFVDFL